ncbi:MAG: NAD(P)-dependent oxidoreductase [Candidatus Woesearchaeota archaeon]
MKIAFFEINDWEKDYVKGKLKSDKLAFFDSELTEPDLSKIKDFEYISVFIYSKITKEILDKLPKLKVISTRSTGFDHIDIKECRKRGITVCNVPFYGENTVAEHTFALILSLSRHVHKSYVRTLRDDFSIAGLTGFDLKGKTIGVVGGGHIGMHVARIAKGFGTKVLVYDINRQNFLSEIIGFEYADLDDLLKQSDIISLHVPYNKYTHHIIDKKKIKLMKKGAILINTARGQLIDTDALLDALDSGTIGGAGLDVLEGEELIKEEKELLHNPEKLDVWRTIVRNQRILKMDNVVFTPHNAFNSKEALLRILDTTIENIEKCEDNKCRFVVN